MTHRWAAHALSFLVIGINPLWVGPVHAGLGENAASVLSDAAEFHGVALSTSLQQYDIHEMTTESGVRVREYADRTGMIFAVTWNGPVMPDLRRLLGASFDSYFAAVSALERPGVHRSLRLATSGLVVESGGHMRAYSGRAYLPLAMPAGTLTADLR